MTASGVFSRSRDYLLQLGEHLALKPLTRERRRVCADDDAIPRTAFHFVQRLAQRVYRRVLEKNPGGAGDDGVAHTACAASNDGRAECHRLQRCDAEVFDARQDQALGAAEVIDDHVSRYVAEELNVGSAA